MITQRRKAVLKAVKLTERETWGTGLLMYGPKRRDDSAQALKNRYLPLLSTTKVDTIKFKRRDDYRKECVCQTIRTQVLTWVDHYPVAIREEEKGLSGQVGWLLCRELSKPSWRDQFFRAEDLTQAFGSTEIEDSDVKEALKLAVREGFIRPWQNSKKRTRGFRVESVFHVNYEEVIEDGN